MVPDVIALPVSGFPLTHVSDAAQSSDDVPSATAISKGLAAGHTAEKPGAYIHICGTGMLQWVVLFTPTSKLTFIF